MNRRCSLIHVNTTQATKYIPWSDGETLLVCNSIYAYFYCQKRNQDLSEIITKNQFFGLLEDKWSSLINSSPLLRECQFPNATLRNIVVYDSDLLIIEPGTDNPVSYDLHRLHGTSPITEPQRLPIQSPPMICCLTSNKTQLHQFGYYNYIAQFLIGSHLCVESNERLKNNFFNSIHHNTTSFNETPFIRTVGSPSNRPDQQMSGLTRKFCSLYKWTYPNTTRPSGRFSD